MVDSEMKNIIAENCNQYESRFNLLSMSVSLLKVNCDNCMNYKGEKCSRGLYNHIKEIISTN